MEKITLESIGMLDNGAFGPEVDRWIRECIKHIEEYPGLPQVRTLKINLEFKPMNGARDSAGAMVVPSVTVTLPKAKGFPKALNIRRAATGEYEAYFDPHFQSDLFDQDQEGN